MMVLMTLPFLLIDNAPYHPAMIVKHILANRSMMHTSHPPSSPDRAPTDFSVFTAVKPAFKGRRFQVVEDTKKNANAKFNAVLLGAFVDCSELYKKRGAREGDYFEEHKNFLTSLVSVLID
jgi:hypothetical protein